MRTLPWQGSRTMGLLVPLYPGPSSWHLLRKSAILGSLSKKRKQISSCRLFLKMEFHISQARFHAHYVADDDLEFLILLCPPPMYWDYSPAPPHLAHPVLRMEPRDAKQALFELSSSLSLTLFSLKGCRLKSSVRMSSQMLVSHTLLSSRGNCGLERWLHLSCLVELSSASVPRVDQ